VNEQAMGSLINLKRNLTIMQQIESITAIETLPSTTTTMSIENASRLAPEKSEIEVEIDAKYGAMALEDRAFEILKDLGMIEIHEFSPHNLVTKEEQANRIESIDSKEDGVVHNEGVKDNEELISTIKKPFMQTSVAKKLPFITTKKQKHHASKVFPKQDVSQAELAAKYAEMTLEDRAFEILKDLGLVEIHEVLTEEEQRNYSEVVDSPESVVVRTEDVNEEEVMSARKTEVPEEKNETLSKRQRLLRPIRRVFEKSKENLLGKSAASLTSPADTTLSLSKAIKRARRQPKSPSEEAILAEKYGQLSLEDRAYAILSDLGMIESN